MSESNNFRKFLEDALADYFSNPPTDQSIKDAFQKLKDKTKYARNMGQLSVIGDLNKRIPRYADDNSNLGKYAWKIHLELDKEFLKADERLRTDYTSTGVGVGVESFRVEGKKQKHKIAFVDNEHHHDDYGSSSSCKSCVLAEERAEQD